MNEGASGGAAASGGAPAQSSGGMTQSGVGGEPDLSHECSDETTATCAAGYVSVTLLGEEVVLTGSEQTRTYCDEAVRIDALLCSRGWYFGVIAHLEEPGAENVGGAGGEGGAPTGPAATWPRIELNWKNGDSATSNEFGYSGGGEVEGTYYDSQGKPWEFAAPLESFLANDQGLFEMDLTVTALSSANESAEMSISLRACPGNLEICLI